MVALLIDDDFVCGGTLIDNSWVLTADRCVPKGTEPARIRIGYGLDRARFEQERAVVELGRFPGNDGSPSERGRDLLLLGVGEPFVINGNASGYYHRTSPWHSHILGISHRCVGWDLVAGDDSPTTRLHRETFAASSIELGMTNAGRPAGDRLVWFNTDPVDKDRGALPMQADVGTGCFYTIQGQEFLTAIQIGSSPLRLDQSPNDRDEAAAQSLGDDQVRNWIDGTLFDVAELAGAFAGDVGVCSFAAGGFEVFGVEADGTLGWRHHGEAERPPWVERERVEPPPGVTLGYHAPGALCVADGSIELVVTAADGTLWWRHRSPTAWEGWSRVSDATTAVTSGAGVSGAVPGHFHAFARDSNNELRHAEFHRGWTGKWENLGKEVRGTPVSRVSREGYIEVFARTDDGIMWQTAYWLGQWYPWLSHGGTTTSGPALATFRYDSIDYFGRSVSGRLWHRWWSEHPVDSTIDTGIAMPPGEPAAVATRAGRIDVVARESGGDLWHAFFPRRPRR